VWTEAILHVDMDSFFVEVERLDRPDLRNRPVAVGGTGGRGVIASASYEARKFGVHSAQPTAVAMRLCPELIVISPAHGRYGEVSNDVFEIFRSITPEVEGLSLDEAFLDIGGLRKHFQSPVEVGESVRDRVRTNLGLPASVGVAASKFVAKLASEAAKPDGLLHVPLADQESFLLPLPVESLWGVGPATLAGLQRLGIATVGDLLEVPPSALGRTLGPSQGAHLHDLARGIDNRPVETESLSKSISVEETYAADLTERALVDSAIMSQSHQLSARLRRAGLAPRTIILKVRFADFETLTRSRTLPHATVDSRDIYHTALDMFSSVPDHGPIRLLGLGGSSFDDRATGQVPLDADDAWHRVGEAVAAAQDKFGVKSIKPARLMDDPLGSARDDAAENVGLKRTRKRENPDN
jgi:DNA polymerase IV